MNSCPNCSADVPSDQKFCGECGSRMLAVCSACGTGNPPEQRFCGECGGALSDLAARPTTVQPAPTANPASAERRLVSVLFLDLAGFTPFTESRDAEDVRDFITRYFDASKQTIERFGGTVDKYIGDAVMAIWGATRAEEDDAERAVRAGLELIDMVAKLGADEGATGMAARAGIMTGEASVGPGGNDTGLVLGDIVNTASRLQSIGDPGEVLVGQTTHDLTNRSIHYTEVGERSLKGKEDSVRVFRAERILAERGGVGRADVIEAPFVGRDEELRLLKDQLHGTTREQRARLVSIVGQAGIGKSRLVWEFEKYLDGLIETVYWHHGRAPSYGDGLAMWSVAEMVRERCRITETEEQDIARKRLAEAVAEFLGPEERSWVEPQLAALLGIDTAVGERSEMHAAIRLFFERLSERHTVVMVFEDLHWADAATVEFVAEITEWSRAFPILVVALARPDLLESHPEWGTLQRGLISLHLPPLSDPDMHQLVGSLIPSADEPTRTRIVQPAGGIPLFAIEMIRMLLNDGVLTLEDDGTLHPVSDVAGVQVPDSVHAVIGARLDRLSPEDRSVVQDASILGQTFTIEALSAISDLSRETLDERLLSLARRELFELIRDPRSPERGQYGFVQSLIREVAHSRITRDVRRDKHIRVAQWFEDEDSEDVAEVVASHYLDAAELGRTDDSRAAAAAVLRAIRRARSLHSYGQIVSLAERAERVLSDGNLLAPLWEEAADAAGVIGRFDLATEIAQRLVDHESAVGDPDRLANANAVLIEVWNNSNMSTLVPERFPDEVDRVASYPVTEGHARLASAIARGRLLTTGKGVVPPAAKALALAEELDLPDLAAEAMITKGSGLFVDGYPIEGRALITAATHLARELGISSTLLRGIANTAYTAASFKEAIEVNHAGQVESKRVGNVRMFLFFSFQSVSFASHADELGRIEGYLADPMMVWADANIRAGFEIALAWIHALIGNEDLAATHLARTMELYPDADDLQALGFLASRRSNLAFIRGDVDEAIRLARESGGHSANLWATASALWLPALVTGDPELIEEYREIVAPIRKRSALTPMRTLVEAWDLLFAGDEQGGETLLLEACAAMEEGLVAGRSALTKAAFASFVPAESERRERLSEDARVTAAEAGLMGLLPVLERILAGEFQNT